MGVLCRPAGNRRIEFFIVTSQPSHEGLRRQENDSSCKGKKKNINPTIEIVFFFNCFFVKEAFGEYDKQPTLRFVEQNERL